MKKNTALNIFSREDADFVVSLFKGSIYTTRSHRFEDSIVFDNDTLIKTISSLKDIQTKKYQAEEIFGNSFHNKWQRCLLADLRNVFVGLKASNYLIHNRGYQIDFRDRSMADIRTISLTTGQWMFYTLKNQENYPVVISLMGIAGRKRWKDILFMFQFFECWEAYTTNTEPEIVKPNLWNSQKDRQVPSYQILYDHPALWLYWRQFLYTFFGIHLPTESLSDSNIRHILHKIATKKHLPYHIRILKQMFRQAVVDCADEMVKYTKENWKVFYSSHTS